MVRLSELSKSRFFIGCETPQNMQVLIRSRIFALQSIIHYRDESCQCTKKEKEE